MGVLAGHAVGPAEVLLLDEPYASLDLPGQVAAGRRHCRRPQQVLVSTHVLDYVRDYPRVLWLEQGSCAWTGRASRCAAYEAHVRGLGHRPGWAQHGGLYSEYRTWALHGFRAGFKLSFGGYGNSSVYYSTAVGFGRRVRRTWCW